MEAVFDRLNGVSDAVSGYAGGNQATAHYEIVSTGRTGHAESVQVTFDPSQITYGKLLQVFFSVAHDPTELNRQGPDEGTQYRSAIFYTSDEQKRVAEAYIQQLNAAKVFRHPIVTQVVAAQGILRGGRVPSEFHRAESHLSLRRVQRPAEAGAVEEEVSRPGEAQMKLAWVVYHRAADVRPGFDPQCVHCRIGR